jgi:hypothetical protein
MATRYGNIFFKTTWILESLNDAEYMALSQTNKEILWMIVSAGEVSFTPNSNVWKRLHLMFPDGTDTWTNLYARSGQEYIAPP